MSEAFSKYHGIGNDFVVLDRRSGGAALGPEHVVAICDRHRGVGADGVLTVWTVNGADARMQIQNADGSDSEMCGNGLRCVAAFLHDTRSEGSDNLVLAVDNARFPVRRVRPGRYRVQMGQASTDLPGLPSWAAERQAHRIDGLDNQWQGVAVGFGNPHVVIFTEDDPMSMAHDFGARVEGSADFPQRVNASFVRVGPDGVFHTVVHERGVGITQACGSGACAVANAARWTERAKPGAPIPIHLPGGVLEITIGNDGSTFMEGDAEFVFRGELSR